MFMSQFAVLMVIPTKTTAKLSATTPLFTVWEPAETIAIATNMTTTQFVEETRDGIETYVLPDATRLKLPKIGGVKELSTDISTD